MSYESYLLAAGAAFWLGIGGYCLFLGLANKRLEERVKQMEMLSDDGTTG